MDHNMRTILDMNQYCKLEIMEYIIANSEKSDNGKSQSKQIKYANLINLILAHKDLETLLREYYTILYYDLEFVLEATRETLEVNFSELQVTHTGKAAEAFWRCYANAISENSIVKRVDLHYSPKAYDSEFLLHFQIIKQALENKRSLREVNITLRGYSLDDLNNFYNITVLNLDVRMSAAALVSVCKANPQLLSLKFMSTEIYGRLSDIVPHCENLEYLEFVPKPDVDVAEYAPLTQLPNLTRMNVMNRSLFPMFEMIRKLHGIESAICEITFTDKCPTKKFPRLQMTRRKSGTILVLEAYCMPWELVKCKKCILMYKGCQDFSDFSHQMVPDYVEYDVSELASKLKKYKIESLFLFAKCQGPLKNLLALLRPEGSYALKNLNICQTKLDQFEAAELGNIPTLRTLYCKLTDWQSFQHLCKLTNLQEITLYVFDEPDSASIMALCTFLNTRRENLTGRIYGDNFELNISCGRLEMYLLNSFNIEILDELITNLKVLSIRHYLSGYLVYGLFDQLPTQKSPSLQRLQIKFVTLSPEEIFYISSIRSLKELELRCAEPEHMESLAALANSNIEKLTIFLLSPHLPLINLLQAYSSKNNTRLQYLKIQNKIPNFMELEEISKIRSLKMFDAKLFKLESNIWNDLPKLQCLESLTCSFKDLKDLVLPNVVNLEELIIEEATCSLTKVFQAFSSKSNAKLQVLTAPIRFAEELNELSRIEYLYELNLSFATELTNLGELAQLGKLKRLNLKFHDISES